MFSLNVIGAVFSLLSYIYSVFWNGEDSHSRIFTSSTLLFSYIMIGLSGAIGEVFVYLTISLFDSYLLTVFATTRKFFSVVFSNFIFGHHFSLT